MVAVNLHLTAEVKHSFVLLAVVKPTSAAQRRVNVEACSSLYPPYFIFQDI